MYLHPYSSRLLAHHQWALQGRQQPCYIFTAGRTAGVLIKLIHHAQLHHGYTTPAAHQSCTVVSAQSALSSAASCSLPALPVPRAGPRSRGPQGLAAFCAARRVYYSNPAHTSLVMEVAPQRPAPALAATAQQQQQSDDPLIQYVVLRSDLWQDLKWPLGSVAAQVVLEVKNEAALQKLSEQLHAAGIAHKLWVEQPENYATSIAIKPYPKSKVGPLVRKLQLCRTPVGKV